MNQSLFTNARGVGTTETLARAVAELKGVLICATTKEAKRVAVKYGIRTTTVDGNVYGIGVKIWENDAIMQYMRTNDKKTESLEIYIEKLEDQMEEISKVMQVVNENLDLQVLRDDKGRLEDVVVNGRKKIGILFKIMRWLRS